MQSEYVENLLDRRYLQPIPDALPRESLPVEDWEIREAMVKIKGALIKLNSCTLLDSIFKTSEYKKWKSAYERDLDDLNKLINKTPVHRAALIRTFNDMPSDNGFEVMLKQLGLSLSECK